jgi:FkbM family methyltransferase
LGIVHTLIDRLPLGLVKRFSAARYRNPVARRLFEWAAGRLRKGEQTISRGAGKGLRFDTSGSNPGYVLGTSEPFVQDALVRLLRPSMTVYDIGANVGFYAVIIAKLVGPGGRVISFEPIPNNADRIEQNLRINGFENGTVLRQALGGTDGRARFLIAHETVASKLADVARPSDPFVGEIEVEVRRLDSLKAEGRLPSADFIKMDAEGSEPEILAGATETVNATRPLLLIELHGTDEPVAAALARLGYHPALLKDEGPYCRYLLAAPAERRDLVDAIESVCRASVG